jgi:hypothetical protein
MSNSRQCATCGEVKQLTEFYSWTRTTTNGPKKYVESRCKPCNRLRAITYYRANPNAQREKSRRRMARERLQSPGKARERQRAWRAANPDRSRAISRRQRGYPEPTRPEPSLCECCGKQNVAKRTLALDHDHITGQFRGWLCNLCNTAIGKLGDTLEGVERAVAYLKRVS